MTGSPAFQRAIAAINSDYSLNDAQRNLSPSRAYSWFYLMWFWCIEHDSSAHRRFYDRFGRERYYNRINRCRAFISKHSAVTLRPIYSAEISR